MDRKALVRQYKETPRPIGVFRVRIERNGKALRMWLEKLSPFGERGYHPSPRG